MATTNAPSGILVERPDQAKLRALQVNGWPIWTKEPSSFEWSYDEPETCYFLDGQAVVRTDEGEVTVGKGDLVTFPKGLRCTWRIREAVRKHYRMG